MDIIFPVKAVVTQPYVRNFYPHFARHEAQGAVWLNEVVMKTVQEIIHRLEEINEALGSAPVGEIKSLGDEAKGLLRELDTRIPPTGGKRPSQ